MEHINMREREPGGKVALEHLLEQDGIQLQTKDKVEKENLNLCQAKMKHIDVRQRTQ